MRLTSIAPMSARRNAQSTVWAKDRSCTSIGPTASSDQQDIGRNSFPPAGAVIG